MTGLIFMCIVVTVADSALAAQLRSLDRDNINATWLLVKLSGNATNFSLRDFAAHLPTSWNSLADVQRLASETSCETVVVQLSFVELCELQGPSVVLLRHGVDGGGQFAVVISNRPGKVTVIRAGSIEVEDIPEDDFRRIWTGHAVIPVGKTGLWLYCSVGLAGAVSAVFVRHLYLKTQSRNRS